MKNEKFYGKSDICLKWDYTADPTWLKEVNVEINEVVKDKKKIKEIEEWYKKFSEAEEIIHNYEEPSSKITKKQVENAVINLKEKLIPLGQKLADDIGAVFHVDLGCTPKVKKLVSKILGKNI